MMMKRIKRIYDVIKTFAFKTEKLILDIPFSLFCLFPLRSNSIFVYGFLSQGWGDHPKYILSELNKRSAGYKVYWPTYAKNPPQVSNVTYVKPKSLKALYYQATSKIWIATVRMPYYAIKRKGQIYIQTWHGAINMKRIEGECLNSLTERYVLMAKHDSDMIDYLVCANEDKVNLFTKYFWLEKGELLKIGSPRNDILVNKEFDNSLKGNPTFVNKKVVLYAPTFRAGRGTEIYRLDFERLLNVIEESYQGEWILVIRLHPTMAGRSSEIVEYGSRIVDGSGIDDVQELLAITDILITDYSSIIFDFLDTGRPAFIYAPDIEEYKKERDFHLQLEDTPFDISTTQTGLETSISQFDEAAYNERLKIFRDKMGIYDDGHASEKIAKLILHLTSDN